MTLVTIQGPMLAAALWRTPRNRRANRRLAALLVVLVGMITPYTIGLAGFYDALPWPRGAVTARDWVAQGSQWAEVIDREE